MGGNVIDIKTRQVPLTEDHEFIVDLARFAEGLASEQDIRKKYRVFDNATWDALGSDDELVRKITDEKTRRIRNGSHKREKAQLLVVKAPDVAASIMNSVEANDRHRLDACKVLNDFAANPMDNTPAAREMFSIVINLGSDVDGKPIIERFDKSIAIDANNGEGASQGSLPITNKWDDDSSDTVAAPTRTGYQLPDHKTATPDKQKRPSGVVLPAAEKPNRVMKHKTGKLVERKTPVELALESLMSFEG